MQAVVQNPEPMATHPRRLEEQTSLFSRYVATHLGLDFPEERSIELDRRLGLAAAGFGFPDKESFLSWLLASPATQERIQGLASELTVGETYFFRDRLGFQALEEVILPPMIRSRRAKGKCLKFWSAGCSSGEEPYSLAILLRRLIPDWKDWDITILATDINPDFLAKAREGVYGRWSFRDTPQWVLDSNFRPRPGDRWEVLPEIKSLVHFTYANLAEELPASLPIPIRNLDLILCRNVLLYLTRECALKALSEFYLALADDGYLMVGQVEAAPGLIPNFFHLEFPRAAIFRKTSRDHPVLLQPETSPPSQAMVPQGITGEPAGPVAEERADRRPPGILLAEAEESFRRGSYEETLDLLAPLPWLETDSRAMSLLARIYANQGKLGEALSWCDRALDLRPLDARLHGLRAMILEETGDWQEAARSLERGLFLDPGFIMAHFNSGSLAQRQGLPGESKRHFRNALNLLHAFRPTDAVPDADGLFAGRLREIIQSSMEGGA
jgi:chemotaxis protein methyltransferase CheR